MRRLDQALRTAACHATADRFLAPERDAACSFRVALVSRPRTRPRPTHPRFLTARAFGVSGTPPLPPHSRDASRRQAGTTNPSAPSTAQVRTPRHRVHAALPHRPREGILRVPQGPGSVFGRAAGPAQIGVTRFRNNCRTRIRRGIRHTFRPRFIKEYLRWTIIHEPNTKYTRTDGKSQTESYTRSP